MDISLNEAISGVVVALLALANALIYQVAVPYVKSRTTKEERANAYGVVQSAVKAAEHLGIIDERLDGAAQKRHAVSWITREFKKIGIEYDREEVDGWIEDALYDLKYGGDGSLINILTGAEEDDTPSLSA